MIEQGQLHFLKQWVRAESRLRTVTTRVSDERGEVTGQTALIVLLVTAAIAAGVAITNAINSNTSSIPTP